MQARFPSAGAPVLNCPGCGSKVAANASICSVCDYIIDTSFLSAEPPGGNDEDSTDAGEDPRAQARPAAPARRPAGKSGARAAVADSDATNVKSMDDIVRSGPQRARPAPSRARPAPSRAPAPQEDESSAGPDPWDRAARPDSDGGGQIADADELMADARELMSLLKGGDKVAFWGAAAVLLSCFLPWKETAAEGDVLGLMSLGFGAFLLSLVVMSAIGIRVRGSLPNLNPAVPWMGQLVTSFLLLVWCIIFIKVSSDTTRVPNDIGNTEMMISSPSFGVFLALLGAVAALGGSLLGLKEKPA